MRAAISFCKLNFHQEDPYFREDGVSIVLIASLFWCSVMMRSSSPLTSSTIQGPQQSLCQDLQLLCFSTHLYRFSLCHLYLCSCKYLAAALKMFVPQPLSYVTVLCCYLIISATISFLSGSCYFLICSHLLMSFFARAPLKSKASIEQHLPSALPLFLYIL